MLCLSMDREGSSIRFVHRVTGEVIKVTRIQNKRTGGGHRVGLDASSDWEILRDGFTPRLCPIQSAESDVADLGRINDPIGVAEAYGDDLAWK